MPRHTLTWVKQALRTRVERELVPKRLARRQAPITSAIRDTVCESLKAHYFADSSHATEAFFNSQEGSAALADHVERRLLWDRYRVVPWLDSVRRLDGSRILEIGCGTGSSTVALAEQGAAVTAIDLDGEAIEVARERCRAHGVTAEFRVLNATEIAEQFKDRFDWIIFFATLEHMTHAERLTAMRATWAMLGSGGLWAIVDSPNRLWWYDAHTGLLPFYHWLPNEVAAAYAVYSPRSELRRRFAHLETLGDQELAMARTGRGISYHEFELAIGPLDTLSVVSCLRLFLRRRSLFFLLHWHFSANPRFEALLRRFGPSRVQRAFYQPYLDVVLQKL